MAVTTIGAGAVVLYGLSGDTKPVDRDIGSLFIEEDTGLEFSFGSTGWFRREQLDADSKSRVSGRSIVEDSILSEAPLGYEQEVALSSSVSLSGGAVPTGATIAVIQAEGQNVRWRDDSTAPTASVGNRLLAGESKVFGNLSGLRFIEEAASAKLNVSYY